MPRPAHSIHRRCHAPPVRHRRRRRAARRLFVSYTEDEATTRAALEANPLWDGLRAVREGRVFFVPQARWADVWSVSALDAQLADIERALITEVLS